MSEIDTAPLFASYDGAIQWFQSRLPLTDADVRDLSARARERAFWAAGASTAAQVETLQASLTDALKRGLSVDQWRAQASTILTNSSRQHLETVFRTNTQAAYSAARQSQMYAPAVLRRRPFGLVQTVDDHRRSKICTGFAGTLMPLDDPGWLTRTPPYHYNCRTHIRNITAAQAEALGGPTGWPSAQPQKGFGRASALVGRAQVANTDQALTDIMEARRTQETVEPLEASGEIRVPDPALVTDAMRRLNLDKTLRSPAAVKRFIGMPDETFDERAIRVKTEGESLNITAETKSGVTINRTIRPDGTVFHDFLWLPEEMRNQGYAKRVLKTATAEYAKAGLTRIELIAADDGRYVWPRLGFKTSEKQAARISQKFDAWLTRNGKPPLNAKQPTEIAYHPDGEKWLLSDESGWAHYETTVADLQERLNQ